MKPQRPERAGLPDFTKKVVSVSIAGEDAREYTILVAGGSETVSIPHFKTLSYNPIEDFIPVIRFMIERIGFYVRTDSPWKTMKDFLADAKAAFCIAGDSDCSTGFPIRPTSRVAPPIIDSRGSLCSARSRRSSP